MGYDIMTILLYWSIINFAGGMNVMVRAMEKAGHSLIGLRELLAAVKAVAKEDGITHTALPCLTLLRATRPNHLNQGMLRPSFCMVVQGEKEILIGDQLTRYAEGSFVAAVVSMLTAGHIVRANPDVPYYGICVNLELMDIAAVGMKTKIQGDETTATKAGAYVAQSSPELRNVLLRLLQLMECPEEVDGLGPILIQELIYRILRSEKGQILQNMIAGDNNVFGVAKAIEHIKGNFTKPLSVRELAGVANMSASGFHQKFKAITTFSPIQYQKKVRLLEARAMLLVGDMDVGMAASLVGYESPSQFSREYRRQFGMPPVKDIARLLNDPLRNPAKHGYK